MATTNLHTTNPTGEAAKTPVLKVTQYDLVSSFMMAIVIGLGIAVVWLAIVWITNRLGGAERPTELELFDPGGFLDGTPDETLKLDNDQPEIRDPSPLDTPTDETEIEEVIDMVLELADKATVLAQPQFEEDSEPTGTVGSASGTGKRALGDGPGKSGFPRDQRWFVRFSERGTLNVYARQLDFFGIELGAEFPGGRLTYLSNVSADKPVTRDLKNRSDEKRLNMSWRGGNRRKADVQLFRKAGIDAAVARIRHFYPAETEAKMARREREYRNLPVSQILRTYFLVRSANSGYKFVVTRQSYKR